MNNIEIVQKRLKGLLLKRPGFAVALTGPAGIGKTFTVRHLLQATPCRNLSIHATTSPNHLARALPKPKKLQVWAERTLERIETGEFVETKLIVDLLGSLLAGLAPFVLHLEDVHELAAEHLEFVEELARVAQRLKGVALIVTSRQEILEPFEEVRLEGLSSADVTTLLEREAGTKLPLDALEWIHSRAAGNPLFTLEFFRFLTRQGFLWNDGQHWHWREPPGMAIPRTVEALIERAILEAFPNHETQTALKAMAYLAKQLPNLKPETSLLAKIAGLEGYVFELAEQHLRLKGVLNETGFAHPLFHEVSTSLVSAQTRRDFARNALEFLPLNDVAVFIEDAQIANDQSLELLKRAARNSDNPGPLLARAVDFASGEERTQLALEAARALRFLNFPLTESLYQLALNGDTDLMFEFITFLANYKHDQAKIMFEQLPEEARQSAAGLKVRFLLLADANENATILEVWQHELNASSNIDPDLLVQVISVLIRLNQVQAAINLADQVLLRSDLSPKQQVQTLNRKANAEKAAGRHIEALGLAEQTLELLERHNLGRREIILNDIANLHWVLGHYQQAIETIQETIRLSVKAGDIDTQMMAQSNLGHYHMETGNYQFAEDAALKTWEYRRQFPPRLHARGNLMTLVWLYLGWFENPFRKLLARKYSRISLEFNEALQDSTGITDARTWIGYVELEFGSAEKALELALETKTKAEWYESNSDSSRWYNTALEGQARAKLGQRDAGIALLNEAVREFEKTDDSCFANDIGLQLDRLTNNLDSARKRISWFRERGLMYFFRKGIRLFPELAEPNIEIGIVATHSSPVRLELLGLMQATHDQTTEPVRGRKRQHLLALLLEARISGRNEIHQLELIDMLYPDEPEDRTLSSLKQAVRGIRISLGSDTIQTTSNGYALGAVTSDVETFLTSGEIALWRGPYLDGLSSISDDDSVRENLHLALLASAQRILESEPEMALRAGRILMAFDAYNLEHLALCVRALQLRNNHKSLNRLYQETRAQLLEVAEVIPGRWQDFLNARAVASVVEPISTNRN